jgi:hypothetical protein
MSTPHNATTAARLPLRSGTALRPILLQQRADLALVHLIMSPITAASSAHHFDAAFRSEVDYLGLQRCQSIAAASATE